MGCGASAESGRHGGTSPSGRLGGGAEEGTEGARSTRSAASPSGVGRTESEPRPRGPGAEDAQGWGVPALAGADVELPQESRYWKVDRNLTLFAAAAKLKTRAVRAKRRMSEKEGFGVPDAEAGAGAGAGAVGREAEAEDGRIKAEVDATGSFPWIEGGLVDARVGVAPQCEALPAIEGVSASTPRDYVLAMGRLNALRRCYGFPEWTWSEEWARKAAKHCEYHVKGPPETTPLGHFEDKGHPLYSEDGDLAARTSGIAFGGRQLLDFVDSMLEGPLHRKQFLSAYGSSNGGAFLSSADGSRACCLMPGSIDYNVKAETPRWLIYPPEGFMEASPKFVAERPEPRPRGHRADYGRGELGSTGLIVEVAMSNEADHERYMGVSDVSWFDCCTGEGVVHWQSCPIEPSIEIDDAIWRGLYNCPMPKDPRQNHLAQKSVMLGALSPVSPGHTFEVKMTLHFESPEETVPLKWRFGTRAPVVHKVLTPEDMHEAQKYIGLRDSLELGPGIFSFFAKGTNYWFPAGVRELRGAGAGKTRLEVQTLCFQESGFVMRDVTLETKQDSNVMLYLHGDSGAEVLLDGVSLCSSFRAGHIGRGTQLRVDGCDLAGITAPERLFCWVSEGGFDVGPKGVSGVNGLRNYNGAEWLPIE